MDVIGSEREVDNIITERNIGIKNERKNDKNYILERKKKDMRE